MRNIFFLLVSFAILNNLTSCSVQNESEEAQIESRIDSLIQEMTLEEKFNMIHASSSFTSGGVERLGIPELVMSDGPHGVRHEHGRGWTADPLANDSASYLPTGITLASTWNRDLGYIYGTVLGNEAKARGKNMILGPGINIIRSPLNGRNFEYLSEDPYLVSEMAVGYIKGVQDMGTSACAKHYIANNQESYRHELDVYTSERALRELYLPAFKASVIQGDVYSVMGAYNKFRGQYCSHNDYLINKVLKDEMGFSGILVSDWSAVEDTREALLYGCDIEMGTDLDMLHDIQYNKFFLADSAMHMVQTGEVDVSIVDDKVRRILRVMHKINMFSSQEPGIINAPEHQRIALQVAEEGIVLLKNDNILPLQEKKLNTIAVIGQNAVRKYAEGGGSSQVKALYEVTPLEGIQEYLGERVNVKFAPGYEISRENIVNVSLRAQAVKLAQEVDAVIIIGGWIHNHKDALWGQDSYDREGIDKKNLNLLFGQEELIKEIAAVNNKVSVVIMGGSQVTMNTWKNDVGAIIQAWYPGMEGGTALANIIFGKTNPSGKLPVSFADTHLEYPSRDDTVLVEDDFRLDYFEGIYVGYRHFDKKSIETVFPFGHGLSYTQFTYSDISVQPKDEFIEVYFTLKNTGSFSGAEIAQLYIQPENPKVDRAIKELKAFDKVFLDAGESDEIILKFPKSAFAYYDEDSNSWVIDPGQYTLLIGSSSADIRLNAEISL